MVFVVVVLGINLAIAAKIYSDSSTKPDKDNPYSEMELITQVMELVRKEYVDTNSVTYRAPDVRRAQGNAQLARSAQPVHGTADVRGHEGGH